MHRRAIRDYRLRHDANGSAWAKDHIPPNGIFHLRGFRYSFDEDSIGEYVDYIDLSPRKRAGRERFRELSGPLTKATSEV